MAGLLGVNQPWTPNNVLGGVQIQTSLFGQPIPIVYGRNRISGNLIWYSNFQSTPVSNKGGKGGLFGTAGKDGQQMYDYAAAVMIAICQGPITNIGAVWDTQGTLPVNETTETYTVPSGGGSYNVTQQQFFLQDKGCAYNQAYSVTVNDYGSPGPVTLSGTQAVPMTVGSGLGQYTESGGTYSFSAANAGLQVAINYTYGPPNTINSDPIKSYNLSIFNGGQGQTAWGWLTSNHPNQALGYSTIAYVANNVLDLGSSGILPNLSYEVYGLLPFGQGTWDANPAAVIYDLLTNAIYGCGLPAAELGDWTNYSDYCVANSLFISPSLQSQRTAAEYVKDWLDATNAEMLRSGWALVIRPYGDTTAIGNGATFTPQTQPVYDLNDDYFLANNKKAPVEIERDTVQDAYNAVRVQFSDRNNSYNPQTIEAQYLLGIQSYGYRPEMPRSYDFFTTSAPAAACAQTLLSRLVSIRNKFKLKLPQVPGILLDPMDLVTITDPNLGFAKHPVRVKSITEGQDKTLTVTLEDFPWGNGGPTEYPKQSAASPYPAASADPGVANVPVVLEPVSQLRANATVPELWLGLSGNSVPLGFSGGGGEGAKGYAIVVNGAVAAAYVSAVGSGYTSAPAVTVGGIPGGSGAMLTATVAGGQVTAVSIGAGGANYASAWGGCRVWLSEDSSEFFEVGIQQGAAVVGVTTADWPEVTTDPDTAHDLAVDVTESAGALETVTTANENSLATLFYVQGGTSLVPYELGAYGVATLESTGKYTLQATGSGNFLRRNLYGSGGADHPAGSQFCLLTKNIFKIKLQPSMVGKTLYLKLTSFNTRGNMEQSLAAVPYYTVTPQGLLQGFYNYGYTVNPESILTQDPATLTQIDIAPFTIEGTTFTTSYLGGHVSVATLGESYYVYVYDPSLTGENSALGIVRTYEASVTPVTDAGWFFLGTVSVLLAGGGSQTGPGGNENTGGSGSIGSPVSPTSSVGGANGAWFNPASSPWPPSSDVGTLTSANPITTTATGTVVYGFTSSPYNRALPPGVSGSYAYANFVGLFNAVEGQTYTIGVNCSGGVAVQLQTGFDTWKTVIDNLGASLTPNAEGTFNQSVQWTAPVPQGVTGWYSITVSWANATETPAIEILIAPAGATTGTALNFLQSQLPLGSLGSIYGQPTGPSQLHPHGVSANGNGLNQVNRWGNAGSGGGSSGQVAGQNLLFNPIGASGLNGWTTTGSWTGEAATASYPGRFYTDNDQNTTLSQPFTPVVAGPYTLSCWLEIDRTVAGAIIGCDIYDATTSTVIASDYFSAAGTYQVAITVTLPNTTDAYYVRLVYDSPAAAGAYWYQTQFELGSTATAFNDSQTSARVAITHSQTPGVGTDGILDGSKTARTLSAVLNQNTLARSFISAVLQLAPQHFWRLDTGEPSSAAVYDYGDLGLNPVTLTEYDSTSPSKDHSPNLVAGDSVVGVNLNNVALYAADATVPTTWTFGVWFKKGPGAGPVLSRSNVAVPATPTSWEPHLWVDAAGYVWASIDDGSLVTLQSAYAPNWSTSHFIAMTVDSTANVLILYIDGQPAAQASLSGAETPAGATLWHLNVAYTTDWPNPPYPGTSWSFGTENNYQDAFLKFNTALPASTIQALYQAGSAGAQTLDTLGDGTGTGRYAAVTTEKAGSVISSFPNGVLNPGGWVDVLNGGLFSSASQSILSAASLVPPYQIDLDVYAENGCLLELLLWQSGGTQGYILRFDSRSGFPAGQVLTNNAGTYSNIGTQVAPNNPAALTGWHHLTAIAYGGGYYETYVDGQLGTQAQDSTYTVGGQIGYGYGVAVTRLRNLVITGGMAIPSQNIDSGLRSLINAASPGHQNMNLEYVVDAPGVTRYAVSAVDGNSRALINAASSGHQNMNLQYVGDAGGRAAVVNGSGLGGLSGTSGSQATTSSIVAGSVNYQINQTTTGYVDVTGGSSPTQVQTISLAVDNGYVSVRFYAQIASTNSSAFGYSVYLRRADGTDLGDEINGAFITAGDDKFLTIAWEGIDTSPGAGAQTYNALINTNSGGTVSLIPVRLICENKKV